MEEILHRLPITFELGLMALIVALIVGIPIGVYSAVRQDTVGDYVTRSFAILAAGAAGLLGRHPGDGVPVDLVGLVARGEVHLLHPGSAAEPRADGDPGADPGQGVLGGRHAAHPHHDAGGDAPGLHPHRLAKGLATRTTIIRHALRNALIPVVTLVGLQAPVLVGGTVIMEQIFVIPGMGLLLLEAVSQRDYPIITGVFLVVGVAVVLINLLVDLSYGLLDPKVRYR